MTDAVTMTMTADLNFDNMTTAPEKAAHAAMTGKCTTFNKSGD